METYHKLKAMLEGMTPEEQRKALMLAMLDLAFENEREVLASLRHARLAHIGVPFGKKEAA